jgi:hypothetical protein
MDNDDNVGFCADLQAAWLRVWPRLRDDIDSLLLVAFRVLVMCLDRHGFFRQPSSTIEVRVQSVLPHHLMILLRTNDPRHVRMFASLVTARLELRGLHHAAELAFAIDAEFGLKLSRSLATGKRTALQNVSQAVNSANTVLMEQLRQDRPMILVRPPNRYWSKRERVVPEFPLERQGTATNFLHLLPTSTSLKRVHYSAVGGGLQERLIVALWPVKAPSIKSHAISKSAIKNGRVHFYFKCWDNLPEIHQQQQRSFANQLADYIRNEGSDTFNTVHIVAAPELTLAPQSIGPIISAVATRRNAAWIVFPGSYHIEKGEGVINQAPICVGGVLDQNDLAGDPLYADSAAVKCVPVVFPHGPRNFVENIDGRESLTHLLDTSVGRIAVMICRDFLEENLRNQIVEMCADHLFILSMSPDSGIKFKTAMESVSNFRTGCFFVNAFSDVRRRAAHRQPLRGARVRWMRRDSKRRYYTVVLDPE